MNKAMRNSNDKKIEIPSISVWITLFLLTVLLTSCVSPRLLLWANKLMPEREVTITVLERDSDTLSGTTVFINSSCDLFTACINGIKSGEWTYTEASDATGINTLSTDVVNASITFRTRVINSAKLVFSTMPSGGVVSIKSGDYIQTIDLYAELTGNATGYPFDSWVCFFIKLLIFSGVFLLLYFMIMILYLLLIRGVTIPAFLLKEIRPLHILLLFILLYGFFLLKYYIIGISNFLVYGDQCWYWQHTDLWSGWSFNVTNYINTFNATFRGYLCGLPSSIAHAIGSRLGIDPVPIYFFFSNSILAICLGWALPTINRVMTKQASKVYQLIALTVIFFIFWSRQSLYVSMDLTSFGFFITGLAFALLFLEKRKISHAALSGLLLSASISFRTTYLYGIAALSLVGVVYGLIQLFRMIQRKSFMSTIREYKKIFVKSIIGGTVAILTFLSVCIPQMQINTALEHPGLFPYDSGYREYDSLVEFHANLSFVSNFVLWPNSLSPDSQTNLIKTRYYDTSTHLSIKKVFDVFITNPLDTSIFIGKKLFEGFDMRANIGYVDENFHHSYKYTSRFNLYGFINYFLLICGLYTIIKYKKTIFEKTVLWTMFFSLVLTQTIMVVEQRYYIIGYFILYCSFIFRFIPAYIDEGRHLKYKQDDKFLFVLVFFMYLAFWISNTFYF